MHYSGVLDKAIVVIGCFRLLRHAGQLAPVVVSGGTHFSLTVKSGEKPARWRRHVYRRVEIVLPHHGKARYGCPDEFRVKNSIALTGGLRDCIKSIT